MCNTTTRRNHSATGDLLRHRPNTVGGAGTGTGTGTDMEAGAPGPIFGEPDFAAERFTFIAEATPTDNGFIALANTFHTHSGMQPRTITSIEDLLDQLLDATRTGTGVINRIRIVSHVFFDTSGLHSPTNMMLRFLNGGARRSLERHFDGFATSSIAGLKSMMTFEIGSFSNTTIFVNRNDPATLMGFLRPAQNSILTNVPTDAFGAPAGEFEQFFQIIGSMWALSAGAIADTTIRDNLRRAYDILYADVVSRLRTTIPEPDLNTLRDALIALGTTVRQLTQAPVAGDLPDYGLNVAAALTAVQGDAFVTKLAGVRRRLNAFSKIDIRGCQVGRERTFLTAVQHFFGTSPTVRPTVSGPRWFQHWNEIGFVSARNDGNIGTLFGAGASGYSGAQIQSFLDPWAAGFGIDASHTTFWQTTLGLNALVFAALQWQSGLPATRVPVPRLQALSSANFRDVVARVTQIFLPPNASRPTAAQLTAVDPVLPNAAVWATALTATVGDSENAAQLTARFNDLKAAYEGSDDRASPPAAGRPIPATAPAALTAQNIRDFQTAILSFIDTDAHSRLRPIKQFLTATLAKTQDGPARMRYYLCLGLPFLAFDPAATNANRNFIVVFEDTAGTDRRQEDAVQFWIRAQWQGLIPTSIGTGAHFADSKHTPWLVENHQPGPALSLAPFVVSPTHDYHDKIVIVTP